MASSNVGINEPASPNKLLASQTVTRAATPHHQEEIVIGDGVNDGRVAGVTAALALQVDGSAVTQPVSDGGGSLTVDALNLDIRDLVAATDKVGATVDGGQAADGAAVAGNPVRIAGKDGGGLTQDIATDAAGELQVDILTLPALVAGTANIGDVDVLSGPTGASALQVQGAAAHDAVAAGNPVQNGSVASLDEPTEVADGDAVRFYTDRFGRQVGLLGHGDPEPPVTANGSAAGVSVIAAPGASVSLYIMKGSLHNAGVEQLVSLRDGAAGTIRFTANLAADGGGTIFDFGTRGWKLTANTALVADIAAATVYVNITEYYIAP